MKNQQKSQLLTQELNSLYGRLGSIISELNLEKDREGKNIDSIKISLDLPAEKRGCYLIKIKASQNSNVECQGFFHDRKEGRYQQLQELKQQQKNDEEEETIYNININDTSKGVSQSIIQKEQRVEQKHQNMNTIDEQIQTNEIQETKENPKIYEQKMMQTQTVEQQKPFFIKSVKMNQENDKKYEKSHNLDKLLNKSQNMIEDLKTKRKSKDNVNERRIEALNNKLRKNYQKINYLTSTLIKNEKLQKSFCKCNGILKQRSKKSLSPIFSYKKEYKQLVNLQNTLKYSRNKSQDKVSKNRSQNNLKEFIKDVKLQYSKRKLLIEDKSFEIIQKTDKNNNNQPLQSARSKQKSSLKNSITKRISSKTSQINNRNRLRNYLYSYQ